MKTNNLNSNNDFDRFSYFRSDFKLLNNVLFTDSGLVFRRIFLLKESKTYSSLIIPRFLLGKLLVKTLIFKTKFCLIRRNKKNALLLIDSFSNNYYHFIVDVGQKLEALRLNKVEPKDYFILITEDYKAQFMLDLLLLYGFSDIKFIQRNSLNYINKLVYPSRLSEVGWANPKYINSLASYVKSKYPKGDISSKCVYISRAVARYRKIINEEEVIKLLESKGFITVFCESLTFEQQVQLFSGCKILVGNHGAGLSNLIFMENSSSVVEFRRRPYSPGDTCYKNLADSSKVNHFYIDCSYQDEHKNYHTDDVEVNCEKLSQLLDKLI